MLRMERIDTIQAVRSMFSMKAEGSRPIRNWATTTDVPTSKASRTLSPAQLAKSGLLTGSFVWTILKPGQAWVETCDVSSFYDMAKPGIYKITAQFHDPKTGSAVKSNTIEVAVTKPE